jgi:hypothetical protein
MLVILGMLCLAAGIPGIAMGQRVFIEEFYSNDDGTVQFIMLDSAGPSSAFAGPPTLITVSGSERHVYTFPSNLPDVSNSRNPRFLVATQRFADLYSVQPDFILPDHFLFTRNGGLSESLGYTVIIDLPTDGRTALYTTYDADIGFYSTQPGPAIAVNHAGKLVALAPIEVVDNVEYYNAGLDEYFLTSYPQEISALDEGIFPGWQRTGYTLPTLTGPPAEHSLASVAPVCRVLIGNSHFYALGRADPPLECLNASRIPGSYFETWNAFYAGAPDAVTGSCPPGQAPAYRLWNPNGTTHRYTTQTAVRDEMLRKGYVAEGYGPDAVAMCVANTAAMK